MKRYGFFGGSFNPPTKAHVYLAKKAIEEFQLDKLFFVPVGNYYKKSGLIDEKYRYEMLKLISDKNKKIEVLDIELGLNKNMKAIDAFKIIKEKYPKDKLFYIMGADNLEKITTWKDSEYLVKNFKFIILQRKGYLVDDIIKNNPILLKNKENFYRIENIEYAELSSTDIRDKIRNNSEDIDIPNEVRKYIKENKLYNKETC